jgi:leucyl aminopeptidase (aminopeptidase T)
MNKLYQAADKAVNQSLKIRSSDRFLLITDEPKLEIADALAFWARKTGAEVTTYLMTETLRPITAPTGLFRAMAQRATVMAYVLEGRIEEKPFRSYMVGMGMKPSRRICMMPGLTREMMERLVNIDFRKLNAFTRKVIAALDGADDVVIENALGTRIAFSVKGRKWHNDNGDISRPGFHGNLPAGECYTAPVEETFSGKIVIGLIDDKLGRGTLEFKKGRLVKHTGKGVGEVIRTIGSDSTGKIVGEFGVGTNPGAKVCPNMLEAEKAFGTVHFAIGDSYGVGKNKSQFHYDSLVEKATIKAKGKVIARNGKFLI